MALAACLLLAFEAQSAARSHRSAGEAVLRDYARLAASELLRRGASEVGYRGVYAVLQRLIAEDGATRPGSQEPATRAAALVSAVFRVDPSSRRVTFEGAPDPAAAAWLSERATRPGAHGPFSVIHGSVAGRQRRFAIASATAGTRLGFELDTKALAPFLAAAVEQGPLLPAAVGQSRVGNERLTLVVRDEVGDVVFRRGAAFSGLSAKATADDAYGGVLHGFEAEVEIDPAAASALLIGGLPRSRLPIVLALTTLAAGLLLGSLVLRQRERELERLRVEFLASASHELRTPLTQLRMFTETLRLGRVRSEDERRQALEVIDREARRLTLLVENLLQFSRVGRRLPRPSVAPCELGPLLAEVVDGFQPLAAAAGARLRTQASPGLWAEVDADALRKVLTNLLDNAVMYGPRGQQVDVRLERSGDRLRLIVEDEGPGIPAADRERVFERFHRLGRDRASLIAGTGLGLAVVRELVAIWGGRCWVETGSRGGARVVTELGSARGAPA